MNMNEGVVRLVSIPYLSPLHCHCRICIMNPSSTCQTSFVKVISLMSARGFIPFSPTIMFLICALPIHSAPGNKIRVGLV